MKTGVLSVDDLDKDYVVIAQLATQPRGVFHQMALRPEKVCGDFIRMGETQGVDEVAGWMALQNIFVVHVIGTLHKTDTGWEAKPIIKPYEVKSAEEAYAMACP